MKKLSNIKARRKTLITAVLVVLFGLTLLELTNVTDFASLFRSDITSETGPSESQKEEQSKFDANNKQKFIENGTAAETVPSPNKTSEKSIKLSAQQEQNNTTTVLTQLTGYPDGECKLEVSNGSKSYNKTVEVIYQTEYSTCAGFSVPVEVLGAGTWIIKLTATSNRISETEETILVVR